ncbi:hypothetical protein ABMA27_016713 [Loxostege sticticalis]|uniref:Gustatory receptor n=1 Tax=Loxostege sticticalis TaxID=481309 RepID=A0ABR3I390_LOXSC
MIMLVFGGLEIRILALEVTIKDKAMMIQINYILEVLLLLATCVTAYSSVYFFRYTIVNILNSLASAWIELPTSKNNILKTLQYQVSVTFFLLGLALIAEIAINFSRAGGLWKMFNITMSFIYPQMIQFIVLAFYCVLVQLLVALLKNLNEALETFRRKKSCYRNFETRLSMLDLSVMESVFVKAFEIKRGINETFQATILLTSVQCFHAIVSEAHIIYHGVIVARTLNTHESINFSVWIGYQLIKVYFLAYTGNILKESTVKIGQSLHNIPIDSHDMRSLLEIQHFTSLMACQYTDISVYGYFLLDASFMFKIIASATMYLIILVQFDKYY